MPIVVAVSIAGSLLLSGCGQILPPPPSHAADLLPLMGQICTVQIKRSTLGAAASLPIPPTTDNINGAQVSVSGKVKQIGEDWIVLQGAGEDLWIARTEIMLIQAHGK